MVRSVFVPDAGIECRRQGSDDDRRAFAEPLASRAKNLAGGEVPQCGYCQSGQIMSAADLWKRASDELGSTQLQIRALQKWRLKRVVEYVENHLSERIGLSDLAAVAGLSRMHFARQF